MDDQSALHGNIKAFLDSTADAAISPDFVLPFMWLCAECDAQGKLQAADSDALSNFITLVISREVSDAALALRYAMRILMIYGMPVGTPCDILMKSIQDGLFGDLDRDLNELLSPVLSLSPQSSSESPRQVYLSPNACAVEADRSV